MALQNAAVRSRVGAPCGKLKTLTTYEWVALTDSQLRARGQDPRLRVCYTGHSTFIRQQWLPSVGKWGGLESSQMISDEAPHLALLHVSTSAYKQFKARYKLMTGRQFARHHGPHPWTRAELCFREHQRAQRVLGDANGVVSGHAAPIGTACHYSVATARVALGLLPVEAVLWSALFGSFLMHHVLSFEEWGPLVAEDKRCIWDLGLDGVPWTIETAASKKAVLHVPDWEIEAAE